jgi:formylglycine-generating enzyme required for sulfatase activity
VSETTETQAAAGSVFLSFSSRNRETARTLVQGLRAEGIDVWWDEGGIGWGENWVDKLQTGLEGCGAYLIMLGPGGVLKWVKPELELALKRHVEDGLPILPLLIEGATPEILPPFLSLFQARTLDALDPVAVKALIEHLRTLDTAPVTSTPADVCPFPGLAPFDEGSAGFFLGRRAETIELLQRLGMGLDGVNRRWLQIEGPSGVGKSSLVRAGLIPAIRNGWLEEHGEQQQWAVELLRPGARPLEALAAAVQRLAGERAQAVSGELRSLRSSSGEDTDLAYLLKVACPPPARMLMLIDQLEELFTLAADPAQRGRLDALLSAALEDPDCGLYLITTIRSDFLLRIGELPRLQSLLNRQAGRYDLQPLGKNGLREVVLIPAQRAGLAWSEPSLPERIVDDAVAARAPLPLVANLLRLLWESARARGDRVLSDTDYRELNGVAGALAKAADELLKTLGTDGKERTRRLLLALVRPGRDSQDTKRTITRDEAIAAAGGGEAAERVLGRLSGLRGLDQGVDRPAPRLIAVWEDHAPDGGRSTWKVDLAHEALLRVDPEGRPYWKTLRDWVDESRKRLEDRELLCLLAEKWEALGRPGSGGLAQGSQLRDFLRLEAIPQEALAFLRASRRRRSAKLLSSSLAVIALSLVGYSLYLSEARDFGLANQLAWVRVALLGVEEPEMVRIEPGSFLMGSPEGRGASDERPRHPVRIDSPFWMYAHEVTFDAFDLYALATGREPPGDEGWGRGRRPVINVSWGDASDFAGWYSARSGRACRLPTEAEWEYAARAGTATDWSFGDGEAQVGSHAWYVDNSGEKTHPVGGKAPNPWGLYDVHGNVWEWVGGCWRPDYAADAEDCGTRVLRGGSWNELPGQLRSANRYPSRPDPGNKRGMGFRLVCEDD